MKKKDKTVQESVKPDLNNSTDGLTLFLSLKARWYEMIESGVKLEEYREIKEYWLKRLADKKFRRVQFSYGYTKRTMTFLCDGIEIGTGNPEWGAEPGKEYFVIKLGRRIK